MYLKSNLLKLRFALIALLLVLILNPAIIQSQTTAPPVAKIIPKADTLFGDIRIDNYYWIKEKSNPEVIDLIKAENSYTEYKTSHLKDLQDNLYREMIGRLKETDTSAAYRIDDYYYYTRTLKGKQYPIYCRKNKSMSEKEEVMLDLNELAIGQKYLDLGNLKVSPNQRFLAYSIDTSGSESYSIRIKDLQTNLQLPDLIIPTGSEIEWTNDNNTIYYETLDNTQRPYRLYRHRMGDNPASDNLVYQEDDEAYYLNLSKTRSKKYLTINTESNTTNEILVLDADNPAAQFEVVAKRQHEIKYYIEHQEDKFYILTNENAKNFKIMTASVNDLDKSKWNEYIPHNDSVKIEGIDAFKQYIVVSERSGGMQKIRTIVIGTNKPNYVQFPDPAYSIYPAENPNYDTPVLRIRYSSLTTPSSTFDYDMKTQKLVLIKQNEVKGYIPAEYKMERVLATASDNVKVPILLVYKKALFKGDGTNPLLLDGYGAYGISSDAYFGSARLSLIDRGYVYAIAQIRGGGEMGRWWYDDGKLLNKKNTFTDFIACSEYLINNKYTSKEKLEIAGGSAGGLLIGAVVNMRPDLFKGVIANVPFVDILNTMLDPTIPLTVTEYEEWGNPHDSLYYFYMKSYSPYDNVVKKDYPTMLVTGGLNDPRVCYWEPTKWVSKLRALKTDNNTLLLKINMGEGHFGVSGRYAELKDVAFQYSFLLDALGINK